MLQWLYLVSRRADGQHREALHGVDGVHDGARLPTPSVLAARLHKTETRHKNRINKIETQSEILRGSNQSITLENTPSTQDSATRHEKNINAKCLGQSTYITSDKTRPPGRRTTGDDTTLPTNTTRPNTKYHIINKIARLVLLLYAIKPKRSCTATPSTDMDEKVYLCVGSSATAPKKNSTSCEYRMPCLLSQEKRVNTSY